MITRRNILRFIAILMLILTSSALGQIYKWVDEEGKTHFSSSPPDHGDAETVQPRATNTYSSPEIPASPDTGVQPIKNRKKVVMYSAVWCGVCKKAKNYFKKNQIPFKEYDIDTSEKGRRDYKKLNGKGVPIILVGEQRMNGFSAGRFESMYGG